MAICCLINQQNVLVYIFGDTAAILDFGAQFKTLNTDSANYIYILL